MSEPRSIVVVAPDEFGGTLTAAAAARAIGDGWSRARPHDVVRLCPQSDGGPGLIAVLDAAGVVDARMGTVCGPLGTSVDAAYGVAPDGTVYVEAAQASGLGLLDRTPDRQTALAASTRGVGELLASALAAGARRVVVGLGGTASTDGGRGALDVLGGLVAARRAFAAIDLVIASDVDNPLLGDTGAAAVFGPQKGADPDTVAELEARLTAWADDIASTGRDVRDLPGAGAAGGLGAALLALGGVRRPGTDVVAEATDRAAVLADADVIVTGEGRYDAQTVHGKVIAGLARAADGRPVIVLAGQVVGAPTIDGVVQVHSIADRLGSVDRALAEAGPGLAGLAEDVASRWTSPPR